MSAEFENKVIAVSGAGKGLGRAYARYLASLGASIVVNNRRHPGDTEHSADLVVSEIVAAGGRAAAEYSSVEEAAAGQRILECALDNFGRLDGVIANAGVLENRTFHKESLDEFRDIIEINLFGTSNILHSAFRYLYGERRGSIIVSTSSAGLFGELGLPAYSTSKAAVIGLMNSLSREGANRNVRCNAIAPYADTNMTSDYLPDEVRAMLDADKVAPVVAWLASDRCQENGQIYIAGGGRVARARMLASACLDVPKPDSDAWSDLAAFPVDRGFDGAADHFERFAREIAARR